MKKNARIKYLNEVKDNSISIFFSGESILKNSDQKYDYAVNHHFFYFTGIAREKAILVLIKSHGVTEELLFIERNDELVAKWDGARMSREEACVVSEFDMKNIKYFDEFNATIERFRASGRGGQYTHITDYYFTLDNKDNLRLLNYINELKRVYPDLNIHNAYPIVAELRMVKSQEEVENMTKAIQITKEALETIMSTCKEADSENELDATYDYVLKVNGVKRSFETIAASGKNATVLHYNDNNAALDHDQLMLFDLGVYYNGYASDISRTYPLSGKFTKRQKEIYNICLEANKLAIQFVRPGITWQELNKYTNDILFDGLKKIGLITEREELSKYYYHGVGHYLGLDVHDVGIYSKPLEAGNVITIEPGIYIAEESIGIRIEDDILVTETGCINLSANIIKEVEDIEEFMSRD